MPASAITAAISANPILAAIDTGRLWSDGIAYNRLESSNPAEVAQFSGNLPSPYVTNGLGLNDSIWSLITDGLAVLQRYASFTFAFTDQLDANYLVSDFSNPNNPNNPGIAAMPGNTPILAFNPQTWDAYSDQQQLWIVLHELAHTLGLRHLSGMPAELDFSQFSIMSYNWYQLGLEDFGEGLPLTPMALDIALLQAKYGAPAANVGATTYALSSFILDRDGADGTVQNGGGYVCIWDTAGDDSIVYRGAAGALLNLNAATLDTGPLTGDLADVVGDVVQTSQIYAGLSATAKADVSDPLRGAGGFFSSVLIGGARAPSGFTIANGAKIEIASGGTGNDLLIGNALSNSLFGNAGRDDLFGGSGDDSLNGGAGDDRVFGGLGADTLEEPSGGSNYLRGDEGDDSLNGGSEFDDINGNMGNDTASGGLGDDWVVGGKDNDVLSGGEGGDLVYGNLGADTLAGDSGADTVRGGQQDDVLSGGAGDDYLSGDRDNDTIAGGVGADIFHTFGGAGLDRVTDFSLLEGDRVQLDPGTVFTVVQSGADTVINMEGGGQMILVGVAMSGLTPGWIFGA